MAVQSGPHRIIAVMNGYVPCDMNGLHESGLPGPMCVVERNGAGFPRIVIPGFAQAANYTSSMQESVEDAQLKQQPLVASAASPQETAMTLHVKNPQIGFSRLQFGSLALAAAMVVTPIFAAAQETATSKPPKSSSMPMDHAGKDHMKAHEGVDHAKAHERMDHMKAHEGMGHMKAHEGMSMTGDVDFDFAVNMRKHHQMALMMAEAQLKNGKDAELNELATQVIAAHKKEIKELDKWLAERDEARISQSED